MKKKLTLQWSGTFLELCMGWITTSQKQIINDHCLKPDTDIQNAWYLNTEMLERHFDAQNWWSVDDLEHAMGLVFPDRKALESRLTTIDFAIDGMPVTVDPEMIQLSLYAPESISTPNRGQAILCHGARRQAVLRLTADFEPPFDPSLITLSLLDYPGYGLILMDVDYDGHDDIEFTFGATTYLKPRFLEKEYVDDFAR